MKALSDYITKEITYYDKEYPQNLREIYDPPLKLFYKGNIELLHSNKILAIIGCRQYSKYGQIISTNLSLQLSKYNFIVSSGCARGIDSFAHKGALIAKKPTIAVLGNGLDYIYPYENEELEKQILNYDGLILSEYNNTIKPSRSTFPARNRIISGISKGVIVIEAKEKSGSLITVEFALDQGKEVYAIPGNITSKNSIGTNELIKQGAKVVTNINDIIEDF